MAYFSSREEFLKYQEEHKPTNGGGSTNRVGFFKLADDGDEAVVRFIYSSPEQMYSDVVTVHPVTVDGKFRKVNCLRKYKDPVHMCPLCEANQQVQNKFFMKLVQYETDPETGEITAEAKVFERPVRFINILEKLFSEYDNLSDYIFKISRSGKKGDQATTYSILPVNPVKYNTELYKKDFRAFENYNIVGGPVMDKTAEEMVDLLPPGTEEFKPAARSPRVVTY